MLMADDPQGLHGLRIAFFPSSTSETATESEYLA
jgi:hypothetical protein